MAEADESQEGAEPKLQTASPAEAGQKDPPGLEQEGSIQGYIGARLRQAFDDVAKQPVPDRFLQLMAELDRS